MFSLSRREFLKIGALSATALLLNGPMLSVLRAQEGVGNPLESYPDRDWEKIYRDQFRYDSTFHFLCAPNDTHNCLLRAYVKNGVITRIGPSYGYGKAQDVYGHQASARWDPRCCQKGLALVRRIYGPRRVKHHLIREGFKKWIEAGMPRDDQGRVPASYLQRGKEPFVRISFDEACAIVAKAMLNIATTYSGDQGKMLLQKQGYDEAMLEAMKGAGTQVLKFRGGMPLLGATRIFGFNRFANSLALLDAQLRGVGKEGALGGRVWDSYSWHTDLPPGHTMTCGQQTIDFDLATVEHAALVICWGMNWIATKMPDGHWLSEARLKGTRVVTVASEYQASSNKADQAILVRPGSDPALALGIAHVILREGLYDVDFVRAHTDLPFLVRTDTLKLLKPQDIIADYRPRELRNTQVLKAGEAAPPILKQGRQIVAASLRDEWSDFVVWNADTHLPEIVTRDDAGLAKNFALEGEFTVTTLDGKTVRVRPVFDVMKEHVSHFTPEVAAEICHTSPDAVIWLAREIAKQRGKTLVAVGMGPNHFFNNDLKDRAIFFVCALTKNIGFHSGNIGSYAGNYRGAYFNGEPTYIYEDPFDIELDANKSPRVKAY